MFYVSWNKLRKLQLAPFQRLCVADVGRKIGEGGGVGGVGERHGWHYDNVTMSTADWLKSADRKVYDIHMLPRVVKNCTMSIG